MTIVGAGPAGATVALNLAASRRVLLVDRGNVSADRIGESLAPAARRLLVGMGLWESFKAEGHQPNHGGASVWGSAIPVEKDNLRDLDGPGWHLDRARFDRWLLGIAARRGAALVSPAGVQGLRRSGGLWQGDLVRNGRSVPVRCRLAVDAGGRGSAVGRSLGADRTVTDRLVCGWLLGQDAPGRQAGLTYIQAEPDGWWYSAPLPSGRRVVAFHTDADLPPARVAAGGEDTLLQRADGLDFLSSVLAAGGFRRGGASGFCAAHSAELSPAAGDGWLAVGDAALAFDPLSSQGLFNALYTGLAGAEAAERSLSGDTAALAGYATSMAPVAAAYRDHLRTWYGQEKRWPDRPFWQRRAALADAPMAVHRKDG